MKRVVAYCRVSTAKQEEQKTIESQKAEIEEWASKNDIVITEWFIDDGWSGELLARPELDRLRDSAKAKEFDTLCLYDLGRFSRDFTDQLILIREFEELGIEVVSLHDINGSSDLDRFARGVMGLFHDYERKKIAERMRRGKLHKAKEGKLIGHNPPYGYRYIPKQGDTECQFEVYEPEAEIVRMVFKWVAEEGYSIRKVVKELYERKIPPAKGNSNRWVKSVVERLLKRTDYYGVSYFNKSVSVVPLNPLNKALYKKVKKSSRREKPKEEWYEIEIPAIIDKPLFDKAQERLQANKIYNPRNKKYPYLLTGKVYCKCGHKRVGDGVNGHHYYRSAERIYTFPKPVSGTCKCPGVNAVVLDNSVWNKIHALLTQPELLQPYIDKWLKDQKKITQTKDKLTKLRQALKKLEEEESQYLKALGSKLIEFSKFQQLMKEVNAKKALIKEELENVEEMAIDQIIGIDKERIKPDDVFFSLKYSEASEKQEIMRKLVTSVIVGERSSALVKGIVPVLTDAQNIQDVLKSRNSCLPNVGKSTLFNSLLKKRVALSANYPFATIEPNTGIVAVPDKRLGELAFIVAKEEGMIPGEILKQVQDDINGNASTTLSKYLPPLVPAVVEFVDIAGLVKGASEGAGLGNQFLSHIREVDAIVHVLRDFEDSNIVREGSIDALSDKETIETELALADLQTLEKLVPAQEKTAKVSKDVLEQQKLQILKQIQDDLSAGRIFLGNFQIGDERLRGWFSTLPLLTLKPVLYVYNVSEDRYSVILNEVKNLSRMREQNDVSETSSEILRYAQDDNVVICAKLEEDLVDLSDEERQEYLKEMGIEETGLERLIKKAYSLLGLISFLTAGKKEVRAWTIRKGTLAPQAAGVIHTDFEKKFIRAQVIEFERYIEARSLTNAKGKGWVRTEGKEYEVKDGDVIEFLIGS